MSVKCEMRNSGSGIVARGGAAARSAAGRTQRVKFEAIAINSVAKKKPTAEDAAHYIGLEHIDPGCFVVSRWGGDVAPIGDKLLMKKGDVLFGRRRAYQRKVAIAPFDGIFSAHGMVLRPKTDVVDEKFFPFFILSYQFMNEAIRISVGGLSPTINWGTLKNCEFDLPPMDEQKKLAELLWAANDLKESYKKAITATDEMLKAKFAIESSKWGKDFGSKPLNTYIKRISYGFTNPMSDSNCGPWKITAKDITNGIIDYSSARKTTQEEFDLLTAKSRPAINDVLLTKDGALGRTTVVDREGICINQSVASIQCNDSLSPNFLALLFQMPEYQEKLLADAGGTAIKHLYISRVEKMAVIIPPLSLQREFVAIADKAESAKANLKKSIAAIDQVIKELING